MASAGKKSSKQGSSSTLSVASDKDPQVYCQPCDEEGTRIPAHGYCIECEEHLCETCFTVHKRHKLSRHHTLIDADSMPKSSSQTHTLQPEDVTKPCPKHPPQMIYFYCHDYDELLCSVCYALGHSARKCWNSHLSDVYVTGNLIDGHMYESILKTVHAAADKYKKAIEDVRRMTNKSNNSIKDVLEDIKNFRAQINQRLETLESQAKNAAMIIEEYNNKHLNEVEATYEVITKSLKTSSDKIKQLNASKQAEKLFIELKLAEKTAFGAEEKTLQLSLYDMKHYYFKPNEAILSQLDAEDSLGTITQKLP